MKNISGQIEAWKLETILLIETLHENNTYSIDVDDSYSNFLYLNYNIIEKAFDELCRSMSLSAFFFTKK